MRVANMLPDIQYQMQQSQQALATATEQLSTGLRVNQLSDDPSASANMVRSLAYSANVDQYTSNVSSVLPQMQSADSAISSVVTSLNSAVTLGTEGANGTETSANRQEVASQVQSILSSVIAQANTSFQGVYVFGGSDSTTPPFVSASTTYTSSQGSNASPLAATTALTAGSVTTISDAATGETMTYQAAAGDTIATLQSAIASAVSAGTLSAGTSATINANGQLSIGTCLLYTSEPVLDTWPLYQASHDSAGISGERKACAVDVRNDVGRNNWTVQHCAANIVCGVPAETPESSAVEEDIEPSPSTKPQSS